MFSLVCQIWAGSAGWFIRRASPSSSADPAAWASALRERLHLRRWMFVFNICAGECVYLTFMSAGECVCLTLRWVFLWTEIWSCMSSSVLQADGSRHRPVRVHNWREQSGSVLGEPDPRVWLRPRRRPAGAWGHDPSPKPSLTHSLTHSVCRICRFMAQHKLTSVFNSSLAAVGSLRLE